MHGLPNLKISRDVIYVLCEYIFWHPLYISYHIIPGTFSMAGSYHHPHYVSKLKISRSNLHSLIHLHSVDMDIFYLHTT